jgi:3-phytase
MVVDEMRWEEAARDQNARDLRGRDLHLHPENASQVSSTVSNWRVSFLSAMVLATAFGVGLVAVALQLYPTTVRAAPETTLNVTSFTDTVESDWTAVYYSKTNPLLIGNDGGAENGGLHVYDFDTETPLPEVKSLPIGRTKVVTVAHNVGGKDLAITIAAPDSIIRVYELPSFKVEEEFTLLGDWSAMCSWKSKSRNQYFYIFGKGKAVQFLIRPKGDDFEILEVRTF